MVNLSVNDYRDKRLVTTNGKLQIINANFVSSSTAEGEEDRLRAKMYLFTEHEQDDYSGEPILLNDRESAICREQLIGKSR